MSHQTMIKRLPALRRTRTGETHQEAHRHFGNNRTLGPILDVWNAPSTHDLLTLPGDISRHTAAERLLRDIVLPDTIDEDQQRLETALLLAIRDCEPRISDDEMDHHGHTVFASVSPGRDMMAVTVHPHTVESFVRAILPPLRPSEGSTGIPGLRVESTARHLILRQLDQRARLTHAKVVLKWVDGLRWRRIWRTAREDDERSRLVDPVLSRNRQLSTGERAMFDSYYHRCGPVALGSAILRRYGLVKDAFAIDTWTTGGRVLNVEIEHGPSIHSLVCDLQHPLVGMQRGSVVLDHIPGPIKPDMTFARLIDLDTAPENLAVTQRRRNRPPSLALRTLSDYGTYPDQPSNRRGPAGLRGDRS